MKLLIVTRLETVVGFVGGGLTDIVDHDVVKSYR